MTESESDGELEALLMEVNTVRGVGGYRFPPSMKPQSNKAKLLG